MPYIKKAELEYKLLFAKAEKVKHLRQTAASFPGTPEEQQRVRAWLEQEERTLKGMLRILERKAQIRGDQG